ncbi:MAG: FecR domain-containing protein [Hyphomicrobiaceae bacterium]|jgi:hypothetical protein
MPFALRARKVAQLAACLIAVASAAALAANSRPQEEKERVGVIERAQGQIRIERNGLFIDNPRKGQAVTRRDHLMTGPDSRVLLSFDDGSRLAVGENAILVIAEYLKEEGRRSGALILDLIRGAIRLVAPSPKAAPNKRIEVRTEAATIHSRGVDLWSGPVGEKRAILVMKGQVDVRNDAGLVMLDGKRTATFISDRLSPPEKPVRWPSRRAQETLMTVAIK